VALANAEVRPKQEPSSARASALADNYLKQWLQALDAAGMRHPDAMQVPVNQGAAIAAGQYKSARALVFLEAIDTNSAAMLTDKGWQVLDFSDPSLWHAQFAAHPNVFDKNAQIQ
jgi:hypothetical protein